MNFVLNVDVQKIDGQYSFTLHTYKKITTFTVEYLSVGFQKVELLLKEV